MKATLMTCLAALAGMVTGYGVFGIDEAGAFTKREIANAAYHWGRVDLADESCERLGRNETMRNEIAVALEKVGGEAWKNGYELGRAEARDYLDGSGNEAFCELSWAFYGRNGQTVKNLLIRR